MLNTKIRYFVAIAFLFYNTSVNFNRKFKNLTIESDKAGSNPIKVH